MKGFCAKSPASGRAELMYAEQLLLRIGDNLHAVDPERLATEAAPHLKTLLERVRREVMMLPRPS